MTEEWWIEFLDLQAPESGAGNLYGISGAGENAAVLIAKDSSSRPTFLVQVREEEAPRHTTSVELPNLRVFHECDVILRLPNAELRRRRVSVIQCLSQDQDLHRLFVYAFSHALAAVDNAMSAPALQGVVNHLIELFRAAVSIRPGDALGLWGELLVIANSSSPDMLVSGWHSDPRGRVDFARDREWLEVKTTTRSQRFHSFTFEQVNPPEDVEGAVISIQTEPADNGVSVLDLWTEVLTLMNLPQLRAKVDRLCVDTLGARWVEAESFRFNRAFAEAQMQLYRTEQVPRIKHRPQGVWEIRFVADLSRARAVSGDEDRWQEGTLLAVVLASLGTRPSRFSNES
jgi:hypothetical protein